MTQVIDHAIQIPVSTTNMWALVSNPDNNPRWQMDCQSVAFLNSIRRGIGMRWRFKSAGGKEQVAEVTAWYEGLGFEYTIVDGASYVSNKGRIRLQEVPEGTIVQWTFSYELGGMLAGLRNSLGTKRSLDNQVVESLRNLFRVAKEMYREADLKDAKSLMRDAPNVQERLSYKPRYPSVLEEGKPRPSSATPSRELPPVMLTPTPSPDAPFQRPTIEEPPIAADDTKPNPILAQATASPSPDAPMKGSTPSSDDAVQSLAPVVEAWQAASPYNLDVEADTGGEIAVEAVNAPTIEAPKAPAPLASYIAPEASKEPLLPKIDPSTLDKRDTATISVFELFGIPRPSNTQEMAAVTIPPAPVEEARVEEAPASEEVAPTPTPYTTEVLPSVEGISFASTDVVEVAVASIDDNEPKEALPASMTDDIIADIFYNKPRMGLRRRLRQQLVKLRIAR